MSHNDRLLELESPGASKSGCKIVRMTAALGLFFLGALATPAPAFSQSFVGKWTATAHTPGGDVSETLSVTKTDDGYAITAKLVGPVPEGTPEAGPGTDIVLDGDSFSYKRTLTTPGGALEIKYTGIVSGDKFTGAVDMGFAQAPYTGVRHDRHDPVRSEDQ